MVRTTLLAAVPLVLAAVGTAWAQQGGTTTNPSGPVASSC